MPRGVKKSIEQHKLEGTYRPSEHDGKGFEGDIINEMVPPPKRMTEVAKRVWRQLLPMVQKGQVMKTDLVAFEMLCNAFADYQYCVKKIVEDGYKTTRISTEGHEITQRHYLAPDKKQAYDMLQQMMGKFGLTPADRTKIHLNIDAEEYDELDELLGIKKKKSKYDGLV